MRIIGVFFLLKQRGSEGITIPSAISLLLTVKVSYSQFFTFLKHCGTSNIISRSHMLAESWYCGNTLMYNCLYPSNLTNRANRVKKVWRWYLSSNYFISIWFNSIRKTLSLFENCGCIVLSELMLLQPQPQNFWNGFFWMMWNIIRWATHSIVPMCGGFPEGMFPKRSPPCKHMSRMSSTISGFPTSVKPIKVGIHLTQWMNAFHVFPLPPGFTVWVEDTRFFFLTTFDQRGNLPLIIQIFT